MAINRLTKIERKKVKNPNEKRGGARPGAGRPSESKVLKTESIIVRVSPEQKAMYDAKGGSRWVRTKLFTPPEDISVKEERSEMPFIVNRFAGVPMFDYTVQAGFAEAVQEQEPETVDFNDLLVRDQGNTCVLRVSGQSMIEAGIDDGDLVVVDRRSSARDGDIVVMQIDNEYTIKRLIKNGPQMYLKAENTSGRYSDIYPQEEQEWTLFGVVTFTIKAMNGRF